MGIKILNPDCDTHSENDVTTKQKLEWLINGGKLKFKQSKTTSYLQLDEMGEVKVISHMNDDESHKLTDDGLSDLSYLNNYIIYKESKWFEKVPFEPVFCQVCDDLGDLYLSNNIHLISKYYEPDPHPFKVYGIGGFKYARPVTIEEISEFILKK